jgi:hypothetical protein
MSLYEPYNLKLATILVIPDFGKKGKWNLDKWTYSKIVSKIDGNARFRLFAKRRRSFGLGS